MRRKGRRKEEDEGTKGEQVRGSLGWTFQPGMKEKDEQSSAQGKQVDRKGGTSWEGGDEGLGSESD